MSDPLLIGVDVGTTQVKGAAYDLRGRPLAAASVSYPLHRPHPGWAEQDPEDWWRGLLSVLAQLADQVVLADVAAIGVCSQVNTHVLVDEHGVALLPAITWQDQRCAEVAAALDAGIDADRRIELWGGPFTVDASYALSRAAWIAQERPHDYERGRWLLAPKDYVNLRLCGVAATDPFTSIGLVDDAGHYRAAVLALVDGAARLMAPLRAPESALGTVTASDCGLPAHTVVATATMDAWGNLYGSGVTRAGQAFEVAGTSEIIGLLSDRVVPTPGVVTFPPARGMWLHAGPTQAGGDALRWLADVRGQSLQQTLAAAALAAPGSGALLFLPHLMGERAPLWSSDARGVLFGLSTDQGDAEIARAVLEGVAYSARHLLEAIEQAGGHEVGALALSGGGARSDLWCQIKADVHGRELNRLRVLDSGVLGAALMAGVAAGLVADAGEAAQSMVHVERTFSPQPATRALYDDLYQIYRSLHPALELPFRALSAARERQQQAQASSFVEASDGQTELAAERPG